MATRLALIPDAPAPGARPGPAMWPIADPGHAALYLVEPDRDARMALYRQVSDGSGRIIRGFAGCGDLLAALDELQPGVVLLDQGADQQMAATRAQYGTAVAGQPGADAFALLTDPATALDGPRLAQALAALPDASPAGWHGDLLALAPARKPAPTR